MDEVKESPFDFITRRAAEHVADGIEGEGDGGKHYVTKADIAREKKEWENTCRRMREEEAKVDPIVKYCNEIRGIKPDYELSFEEWKEHGIKAREYRKRMMEEEVLEWRFSDTKRSTKRERKEHRIEKKQREKDEQLRLNNPI